jgi:hypothetical protein
MASALGKIIPTTLAVAMGAGLVLWQQFAVLTARVEALESQANKGERFTAKDGARLETQIDVLEAWREAHTKFGWEQTININGRMSEIERKCEQSCR